MDSFYEINSSEVWQIHSPITDKCRKWLIFGKVLIWHSYLPASLGWTDLKNNWKINEEWMKNEWIIYVSSYIRYFVHRQRSALILFHSVFQPCIYISMKKYKMGCYICILLFSSFFSKRVNKRNAFFVAFKSRWVINQLKTVTENSSAAECQSQLYGRTFTRDDKIVFIFC